MRCPAGPPPAFERWRRGRLKIGVTGLALANHLRAREAQQDNRSVELRGVADKLGDAEKPLRCAGPECKRRQHRFRFYCRTTHRFADGGETDRDAGGKRLFEQQCERISRARLPNGKEICSSQLLAEAVAEDRSGQTIGGACGVMRLEDEHLRQHPLDRTGIDVGLVGRATAASYAAPIPYEKVAVAVFHGSALLPDVPLCV